MLSQTRLKLPSRVLHDPHDSFRSAAVMSEVTEERPVPFHAAAGRFDPAFKLFGSTIGVLPLGDSKPKRDGRMKEGETTIGFVEDSRTFSCPQVDGCDAAESEPGSSSGSYDGCEETKPIGGIGRLPSTVPTVAFAAPANYDNQKSADNVQGDTTQIRARKKPGKPVTCPRCDSLDTKFCYYNNYNVNQPRHFCKNCQRYWTAGGTLRNVPVGAGRRRNKHSAAHQGSALNDDLVARDDEPDAAQQNLSCAESSFAGMKMTALTSPSRLHGRPGDVPSLIASDGTSSSVILSFGQDALLCESSGATSCDVNRLELRHELGSFDKRTAVAEGGSRFSGLFEADSKLLYNKQSQSQYDRSSAFDTSRESNPTVGLQDSCKSFGTATKSVQFRELLSGESRMGSALPTDLPSKVNATPEWAAAAPFSFASDQQGVHVGSSNCTLSAVATDVKPINNIKSTNFPQPKAAADHPIGSVAIGSSGFRVTGSHLQNLVSGPYAWGDAWAVPWASVSSETAPNLVYGRPMLGKHHLELDKDENGGSMWVQKASRSHDLEAVQSSQWSSSGSRHKMNLLTSDGALSDFVPKASL